MYAPGLAAPTPEKERCLAMVGVSAQPVKVGVPFSSSIISMLDKRLVTQTIERRQGETPKSKWGTGSLHVLHLVH